MFKHKLLLSLIVILVLSECALVGGIGVWREYFWASVQGHDLHQFLVLISYFTIMALIACFVSGTYTYLISYTALLVRTDMTKEIVNKHDYQIKRKIEGSEQRIQNDCLVYPTLGLNLMVNLLRSIVILCIFIVIIWHQVGGWYVLPPFIYTFCGTGIAYWIAHPLINLNYINQVVEAKLRRLLVTLKLNSISDQAVFAYTYQEVFKNNYNLFKTTKYLAYFQSFYGQITVIIPYLLLSFVYFSGKITFGILMQIAASMGHIIDSLSYLVNSFNDINNWLSCRKRLKEIGGI